MITIGLSIYNSISMLNYKLSNIDIVNNTLVLLQCIMIHNNGIAEEGTQVINQVTNFIK